MKDSGIGIPGEKQDRVFERFYQVDNEIGRVFQGTGLGLAISRGYASLMGGEILLDSIEGKGSVFTIKIKSVKGETSQAARDSASEEIKNVTNMKGKTILLVEDQAHNMRLLEVVLQNTGAALLKAWNGEEAVDICNSSESIDMVLMDIKLPGMSGLEACRKILDKRPGLPILAQTAFAMSGDETAALEAGCVDYISKPLTRKALLEKMKIHL